MRVEGPTYNGLDYALVYFFNRDGGPVSEREEAYRVLIEEFDNAGVLRRTTLGPRGDLTILDDFLAG